jgi:hypothetical protein
MKIKTPYTEQDLIMENNPMDYDSTYMDTKDLEVTLTCKEHELIKDVLMGAVDGLYALFPGGWRELPEDNELKARYKQLDILQEKFDSLWTQRFD